MGDFFKNDKHNLFALGIIVVTFIALNATDAEAGERECLSKIAYAESRGESVLGTLAVMHSSVNHARQIKSSVCKVPAVQLSIPDDLKQAYLALAGLVLRGGNPDPSKGANSWRSKGLKAKGGKVTAHIGKHRFSKVIHLANR